MQMFYGDALRYFRKTRVKMTQDQLARKSCVSKIFICKIEANQKIPSTRTIEDFCEIFQIPIAYFMLIASPHTQFRHGQALHYAKTSELHEAFRDQLKPFKIDKFNEINPEQENGTNDISKGKKRSYSYKSNQKVNGRNSKTVSRRMYGSI